MKSFQSSFFKEREGGLTFWLKTILFVKVLYLSLYMSVVNTQPLKTCRFYCGTLPNLVF